MVVKASKVIGQNQQYYPFTQLPWNESQKHYKQLHAPDVVSGMFLSIIAVILVQLDSLGMQCHH